jgi:hypothetical protein
MNTKRRILLFALVIPALACAVLNPLASTSTSQPSPHPPTTSPTNTPTIAPTAPPTSTPTPATLPDSPLLPRFPDYSPDDIDAHYLAMRPGFEADVDAFADGTRYWMALNLALDPVRIDGVERVRVVNREADALDDLVFRLYPNHMIGETVLTVTAIIVDGVLIEGERDGSDTVLRVPLPSPLAPGEVADVEMAFSLVLGQGDNLVGLGQMNRPGDAVALPSFFPMLSVYEDGMWWEEEPVVMADPVYSETALFDVWLCAPDDAAIATTGVMVSMTDEEDCTLYHFASGPVRDFALGIRQDFEVLSGEVDGITVTVWSRPGRHEADRFVLDVTERAVQIFSEEFGPYPFNELDVVEVTTGASGIEYPGLYYLSRSIWRTDDTFTEWVAAHETAHQWWYGMVGNDQVGEPWLDEGVTEYSSEVYFLNAWGEYGAEMTHDYFIHDVGDFVRDYGEQLPVGMPANAYPDEEAYDVTVYSAGALFYEALAEEYGRDSVRELLRVYLERFRYDVAHNEDMETLVAEELGEEARTLFREWVYGVPE